MRRSSLARAFDWWCAGLAAALSGAASALRRRRRFQLRTLSPPFVLHPAGGARGTPIEISGNPQPSMPAEVLRQTRGCILEVLVPPAAILERRLEPLPKESRPYLQSVADHQMEAIFPWRAADALRTLQVRDREDGRLDVSVRATARAALAPALALAAACGAREVVVAADGDAARPRAAGAITVPLGATGAGGLQVARAAVVSLVALAAGVAAWTTYSHWSLASELAAVDQTIAGVLPELEPGDIVIDGGNSYYVDDIRRAKELRSREIHYVDVGTSGGVWGLERGYCMMIGGAPAVVKHLAPIFSTLAPGVGDLPRTPGRERIGGTAEQGYLHCGPHGAGHFVKMVHNGIEYGIMAAYAEGLGVLRAANIGKDQHAIDAETTPLRDPEHYQYDLDLRDIAEVWRRGSVIASWLLDLTAAALAKDPALSGFAGQVSDSGEGRWTIKAAIDEAVPVPVLSTALYQRFSSRGESDFQDRLLSAMRFEFGGHVEKK